MKLHSAVHIVDYFAGQKMSRSSPKRIGSNIDEKKGRLDYEYPEHIGKFLPEIEKEANELLAKSVEVKRWHDSQSNRMMWQLDGLEETRQECGGTHVRNTSEIGKITLKRKNTGKGEERIEVYLN